MVDLDSQPEEQGSYQEKSDRYKANQYDKKPLPNN